MRAARLLWLAWWASRWGPASAGGGGRSHRPSCREVPSVGDPIHNDSLAPVYVPDPKLWEKVFVGDYHHAGFHPNHSNPPADVWLQQHPAAALNPTPLRSLAIAMFGIAGSGTNQKSRDALHDLRLDDAKEMVQSQIKHVVDPAVARGMTVSVFLHTWRDPKPGSALSKVALEMGRLWGPWLKAYQVDDLISAGTGKKEVLESVALSYVHSVHSALQLAKLSGHHDLILAMRHDVFWHADLDLSVDPNAITTPIWCALPPPPANPNHCDPALLREDCNEGRQARDAACLVTQRGWNCSSQDAHCCVSRPEPFELSSFHGVSDYWLLGGQEVLETFFSSLKRCQSNRGSFPSGACNLARIHWLLQQFAESSSTKLVQTGRWRSHPQSAMHVHFTLFRWKSLLQRWSPDQISSCKPLCDGTRAWPWKWQFQ